MGAMLLADLVAAHAAVRATRSRKAKVTALAEILGRSREEGDDVVAIAVHYLGGSLRQRRTGLGWRGLQQLPPAAADSSLDAREVDRAFADLAGVSGPGSKAARERLVADLFGRATVDEQAYLRGLVTGELRQGALDALVLDAVASASGVPSDAVRRAAMFAGATAPVAAAALADGEAGLAGFRLEVGRPVRPMLASSAPDLDVAMAGFVDGGEPVEVAVDCKLDGIRMQVHKDGGLVRVWTRSLEEITERVPEVVELVRRLPSDRLVLDGEAIALDDAGRARPFQDTGARTASRADVEALRAAMPLTSYFFDLLLVDGEDLVDAPARERLARLAGIVPADAVVPRVLTRDVEEARRVFAEVVAAGHEGVVVKGLDAPYAAGRRGASWVKVKPRHTLDLVVLAVEWGSGRREGWLSNIHLGARNPDAAGEGAPFVMLGKTFKGMTDEMLAWQTERFTELATSPTDRSSYVVHVRPDQVVEIAFDGIQRSTRYPGGMALRFARVVRYRDDKTAAEADTIDSVRGLL